MRDPIHGLVPMTACEWELVRTRAFGRLRGIRQMGMAYVMFPSAHHTRFEHAIGAMSTAWLLAEGLPFSDDERLLIRMAVLCHDLGHRPYSHSLEDAARRHASGPGMGFLAKFLDHEERTYEYLTQDAEIGAVLARHPEYARIPREEIALAAVGRHPRPVFNLFAHSEIDADRIDYVLRDNYYCGFPPGIDIQAVRDLYIPDEAHGLVLNADRLYVAQQILFARYNLIANIQNNSTSRLGDLMLAECIRASLQGADDERRAAFTKVVDEGQDADLEHFLRTNTPDGWANLQSMVYGTPPVKQIMVFGHAVLSPVARFGIQSLRLEGSSVAQALQDRLAMEMPKPPLIDITRVKPPTDPLTTGPSESAPWHGKVTDLPTVKGIIDASNGGAAIRVYAAEAPEMSQANFVHWTTQFRKLDPSLDPAKAEGLLAGPWRGDRARMGMLLALESLTAEFLVDQVRKAPSRLDALFLTCYLALNILEHALGEKRVYLDGPEAVWTLLRHPKVMEGFGDRYPRAYEGGDLPGVLVGDLAFLQRCGLLYIMTRLERVRNVFVERPKYGTTGWGRRLARLLAEPAGAERLARIEQAIRQLFAPHEETYREYFSLLNNEDQTGSPRRRELRRQMPVSITR